MDKINYETIRRIKLLRPARRKKETYHDLTYALCVGTGAMVDGGKVKCPNLKDGLCSYKVACGYCKSGRSEQCYL